jgi:hypothetical protein
VKLNSWPEIGSDGDVLLTPYVPKGIRGYDDDDDDDDDDDVFPALVGLLVGRQCMCIHCLPTNKPTRTGNTSTSTF